MTEASDEPTTLPHLDPEQFTGDSPAGDADPGEFVSNDLSGTDADDDDHPGTDADDTDDTDEDEDA